MTTPTHHKHIPPEQLQRLRAVHKGPLFLQTDQLFLHHSRIWNGSIINQAILLAQPRSAEDVTHLVKFCLETKLSPSVKAGGYGVAGWSISGDVIIDLSLFRDIEIELPSTTPSADTLPYTSLRDRPITGTSKNPQPPVQARPSDTKRRKASEAFAGDDVEALPPSKFISSRQILGEERHEVSSMFLDGRLTFPETENGKTVIATPKDRDERPAVRRRLHSSSPSSLPHSSDGVPADGLNSSSGPTSGSSDFLHTEEMPTAVPEAPISTLSNTSLIFNPSADPLFERGIASWEGLFAPRPSPPEFAPRISPPAGATLRPLTAGDPFAYAFEESLHGGPAPSYSVSRIPSSYTSPFSFPSTSDYRSSMSGSSSASAYGGLPANPTLLSDEVSLSTASVPYVYVTFGAGMGQKDVDRYMAEHPIPAQSAMGTASAIPYYIPFAAHPVGSGVMLLGGFGFLSRLYGLSIDALVEVEVVLADGTIAIVNEKENSELLWAIKGAGPAFGIVTRYVAKAYPVPVVFAGNLVYNFRPTTAPSLFKHIRDCSKGAPPELYINVLLTAGPKPEQAILIVQMCFIGNKAKGTPFLQALLSCDVEKVLLNEVAEKSFLNQQNSVAKVLRGEAGRQWFIMSDLISSLTDEMINETCIKFQKTPPACTWFFELAGGKLPEFENTCVPRSTREAAFTIAALHQWPLEENDPRCIDTAAEWIANTVSKTSVGGPLPSFTGREPLRRIIGTYGLDNWTRLRELKRKYDAGLMFKHNFWPAVEEMADGVGDYDIDGLKPNKGKQRAIDVLS